VTRNSDVVGNNFRRLVGKSGQIQLMEIERVGGCKILPFS